MTFPALSSLTGGGSMSLSGGDSGDATGGTSGTGAQDFGSSMRRTTSIGEFNLGSSSFVKDLTKNPLNLAIVAVAVVATAALIGRR